MEVDHPHLDPVESFSHIKLISADGHTFFLDRRIAFECDFFKKMVEQEGFLEGTEGNKLKTINGKLLEKVIEYLYYRYKYTDSKEPIPSIPISNTKLPKLHKYFHFVVQKLLYLLIIKIVMLQINISFNFFLIYQISSKSSPSLALE
jgi:transcription elongation factor B subunit 1